MRRRMIQKAATEGSVAKRLMTVPGVGPITATAYVATIDDPKRFRSSEQVAAYLGLVPSVAQSGELEVHGHITKEGDGMLRSYLVEAAHVLLDSQARYVSAEEVGSETGEEERTWEGPGRGRSQDRRVASPPLDHRTDLQGRGLSFSKEKRRSIYDEPSKGLRSTGSRVSPGA